MDTVFFIASKLIWAMLRPDSLLMLGLVAAWALARRRPRLSRGLLGAVLALMALVAAWPVQDWLLRPLETAYPRPAPPHRRRWPGSSCWAGPNWPT